jgi:hypothetical protein
MKASNRNAKKKIHKHKIMYVWKVDIVQKRDTAMVKN